MFAKIIILFFLWHLQVKTSMSTFPSSAEIVPEPLGVVLIISTWNYPFRMYNEPHVYNKCCASDTFVIIYKQSCRGVLFLFPTLAIVTDYFNFNYLFPKYSHILKPTRIKMVFFSLFSEMKMLTSMGT